MKNKFINELAHRLLLVAGFDEMKGVLEDYSGFMGESGGNESPKEIVNSLGINKTKGYAYGVAYIAFLIISFFVMHSLRGGGFAVLQIIEFAPLIILIVVFLIATYLLWGKKASLVSKYSPMKRGDSFWGLLLSLIPTVIIIGFSVFIFLSLSGKLPYVTQMLTGTIVDISFLIMLVCGIIDFVLFYLKGAKYFSAVTINYIAYAVMVQLEIILCTISFIDSAMILSISLVLAEFIIFLVIATVLNKKLGVIRK